MKGLGTAEPVYELIKSTGWRGENLLITSFNWGMLSEYRELDPEARIGPLTHLNLNEAMEFAETINAHCVNPYHKLLTKGYVDQAHRKGFNVYPWTVNAPDDIQRVVEMGVDGVISNYPDLVTRRGS